MKIHYRDTFSSVINVQIIRLLRYNPYCIYLVPHVEIWLRTFKGDKHLIANICQTLPKVAVKKKELIFLKSCFGIPN